MRNLLLTFIILLGPFVVVAANNPLIRACRIENGQFWLLHAGDKDLALCFFDEAAVGADALFKFKTSEPTQAIDAYKNRKSSFTKGGVCGAYDAEVFTAKDSEGHQYNVCVFEDQSMIEETSLWFGPGAAGNEGLDKALKKTY
ncbi:hypothetical protein [Bdellovibrio reynosensis]|uniref:Uncharacterized protein n=1 Tax=Bdellovibrio reynosensis TaxID=2835041 RepID=A0ABY4CB14_9BACT|nr:hypothetical protein [Bdellovibrio reynosensis]UOF01969.1 hypothetical protein MNR06_03250 [Bdellovibrio reynosensis]